MIEQLNHTEDTLLLGSFLLTAVLLSGMYIRELIPVMKRKRK